MRVKRCRAAAPNLHGGRFNPEGVPALYSSLMAVTAHSRKPSLRAASQPTTLVSYDAEIADVFDCRDEEALKAEGMDAAALADTTWHDKMKATGEARRRGADPALNGQGVSCAAGQKLRAG